MLSLQKIKSKFKKDKDFINFVVTIALALATITGIVYGIINHYENKRVGYYAQGEQFRPILNLEHSPKVGYTFTIKIPYEEKIPYKAGRVINYDDIEVNLEINTEMVAKNEGNAVAHLLGTVYKDQYTGLPIIRMSILDGELNSFKVEEDNDFYKSTSIEPGKNFIYKVKKSISDIDHTKNELAIHHLLIYENEQGNIYDSYYIIRFKIGPVEMAHVMMGEKELLSFKKECLKNFKIIDTSFTTIMYDEETAKKIKNFHYKEQEKLLEKYKNKI